MQIAAYHRVSTGHQDLESQRALMDSAGIQPDRTFTDVASGRAGSDRPGWRACLAWLREGDVLVVTAIDRLGRSVREVAQAMHELSEAGISLRSLRENVDTGTATGRAVVSIMATVAELELELGRERRAASRETRLARGLPATCPPKLDAAQQTRLIRLYESGEPIGELMGMFGVSRSTVFRVIRRARLESLAATG